MVLSPPARIHSSIPVICLMGPTASGKSDLAIALGLHFNAELISVDSALIYQGMDIGTAKPSASMRQAIPHHLIDIIPPTTAYSAADFVDDATTAITQVSARGKIPLLVGGTMMYYRVLQQGLSTLPGRSTALRQQLVLRAQREGLTVLHQALAQVDKAASQKIHPNDSQRIIRALEVYALAGEPLSGLQQARSSTPGFQFINIALFPTDRARLHQRIAARFDAMLAEGFIEEVQRLKRDYALHVDCPSMRAVGYRQAWQFLAGQIDQGTLREKAIVATRQLAKRQLTWLRTWPACHFFDINATDNISAIIEHIKVQLAR